MTDTITTTLSAAQEPNQTNSLSLQRNLSDIVAEYEQKLVNVPKAIAEFEAAGETLKAAACVAGTWGETSIETGSVAEWKLKESLLKSAWRHVYNGLNIDNIASAKDKQRFKQAMTNPAPFTLDNIQGDCTISHAPNSTCSR